MGKRISDLVNPTETLNSVLDDCAERCERKLIPLNVNKLSGSRTIECGGKVYNIGIEIKILLV